MPTNFCCCCFVVSFIVPLVITNQLTDYVLYNGNETSFFGVLVELNHGVRQSKLVCSSHLALDGFTVYVCERLGYGTPWVSLLLNLFLNFSLITREMRIIHIRNCHKIINYFIGRKKSMSYCNDIDLIPVHSDVKLYFILSLIKYVPFC